MGRNLGTLYFTFWSDFVHDPRPDVCVAAEGALEVRPLRTQILVSLRHVIGAKLAA